MDVVKYTIIFLLLIQIVSAVDIDKEIRKELNFKKEVPVIIKLEDKKFIFSNEVFKINKNNLKVTSSYKNGFAANITEKELKNLELNPLVKKIYFDYKVKINLDKSIPLIKVNLVPSQINGNEQAVCIVDTGVDYTHSKFNSCFGLNCSVVGGWDFVNNDNNPVDDNGHGTHIAGIIKEIAPESKIVAVKVLDSYGDGDSSNVRNGIEWCITNKNIFNISVISLSLSLIKDGQELIFTNYCDGNDAVVDEVNYAANQGIFVAVAAGNSGNITGITSPACGSNVTSVGAVDDNKNVFFNRGVILDLLAPGVNINSTGLNNKYFELTGTSMAAPHVAGAAALLLDYKKNEENISLTPKQIENFLKNTGSLIYDNESSLNFSLINVFSALLSLDNKNPDLKIISPENKTYFTNISLSFNYSARDVFLDSCWYNLDNKTFNLNNCSNITLNLSIGSHILYLYANDSRGNENFSFVNFNIENKPIISLDLQDGFNSSNKNIILNCSVSSFYNLRNLSFYTNVSGNWSGNLVSISGKTNSTIFNLTNLSDGSYIWNCIVYDIKNNYNWGDNNYSFSIDTIAPLIYLISPSNRSSLSSNNAIFEYNFTDKISNCSLIINNEIKEINNGQSFSVNLNNGDYNWSVNCNDHFNNIGSSEIRNLNINYITPAPSSSGGGGGGGGGRRGGEKVVIIPKPEPKPKIIEPVFKLPEEQQPEKEIIEKVENVETKQGFIQKFSDYFAKNQIIGSVIGAKSGRLGLILLISLVLISIIILIIRKRLKPQAL